MNWLELFAGCSDNLFFGIPNWSTGLNFDADCNIASFDLMNIWLVVANIIRMALALAALLAVFFIIFGGIRYITSRGEPEEIKNALGTILNAIFGLIIAVVASAVVGFIAGRF